MWSDHLAFSELPLTASGQDGSGQRAAGYRVARILFASQANQTTVDGGEETPPYSKATWKTTKTHPVQCTFLVLGHNIKHGL